MILNWAITVATAEFIILINSSFNETTRKETTVYAIPDQEISGAFFLFSLSRIKIGRLTATNGMLDWKSEK